MATYNGEKYIEEQLKSISLQTLLPDELLIIDDGSTDSTKKLIRDFSERSNFKVNLMERVDNKGSNKTFSTAVSSCIGDYVFLCDQDDSWDPKKIELCYKALQVDGVSAVYHDAWLVDELGYSLDRSLWADLLLNNRLRHLLSSGGSDAFKILLNQNFFTGAALAFKKNKLERFYEVPEGWVHDAWYIFLLSQNGSIAFLSEKLLYYRQHSSNQIGIKKLGFIESLNLRTGLVLEVERLQSLINFINEADFEKFNYHKAVVLEKYNHQLLRLYPSGNLLYLFNDFLNGRYHRFSHGVTSFLKDIFYVLTKRVGF